MESINLYSFGYFLAGGIGGILTLAHQNWEPSPKGWLLIGSLVTTGFVVGLYKEYANLKRSKP